LSDYSFSEEVRETKCAYFSARLEQSGLGSSSKWKQIKIESQVTEATEQNSREGSMIGKGLTHRRWVRVSALALSALGVLSANHTSAKASGDDKSSKGEFIPTGVHITPLAAKGSMFQPLNPGLPSDPTFTVGQAVTTAVSPDGRTLLILTSGYNSQNFTSGPNAGQTNPAESNEYIFIFDISGGKPLQTQVLQVPNAFDGLAFNPSGKEFYVSGGPNDDVHFYDLAGGVWAESGSPLKLGHAGALALGNITPGAMGLAVTGDGKRLVVANYENDSASLIDVAGRKVLGELDLRPGNGTAGGEYPVWVAIQGSQTAFISSARDREIVVVDLTADALAVTDRIEVKGQPTRLALNPQQTRLYVAESSSDAVAAISTKSHKVLEEIGTTAPKWAFANEAGFKGSIPNSVTVSPDGGWLYVTNGGANSVAVIQLASDGSETGKSQIVGLIPTGWYPNSASVSADGSMLYVVNGKSNAGPNPQGCRDKGSLSIGNGIGPGAESACSAANQYVWQLTKAGFLSLPIPHGEALEDLTEQVAKNNHYSATANGEDAEMMAFLRDKIKHVIYIVRENRTYDQILGDLGKGNGDPSIVVYPQPITPNQHALASKFVDLDNFYDSGEVSGDGWNWSTSARAADTIEKTEPINYAGRGLNYDYEGTNRNVNVGYATPAERAAAFAAYNSLPPAVKNSLLLGTNDVSAPDSPDGEAGAGYLWNSALRAGLKVRNYGFFIDLGPYGVPVSVGGIPLLRHPFDSGTPVAFATKAALQPITDQFFRGYDNHFPDFYRVDEWEREFDQFEQTGDLPNLSFVRVMHDHTGNFSTAIDGLNTPEIQTADNDYAVGRIVEIVAKSERYRDNTLVFVIEDDAQDGPDHVDAHRSVAFVAGPYVKQGAVVSTKYTTVSMIATIVDILGIQHLGTYDALDRPMTDAFSKSAKKWDFTSVVPDILRTMTQLPLPGDKAKNSMKKNALWAFYAKPTHDAAYWAEKTAGFNFDQADQVNASAYNLILWKGLRGDNLAYPAERDGKDLSKHRGALLKQWRESRIREFTQQQRTMQAGGGN
jgi:DNA-binding beta-propeller fold protein YncE